MGGGGSDGGGGVGGGSVGGGSEGGGAMGGGVVGGGGVRGGGGGSEGGEGVKGGFRGDKLPSQTHDESACVQSAVPPILKRVCESEYRRTQPGVTKKEAK